MGYTCKSLKKACLLVIVTNSRVGRRTRWLVAKMCDYLRSISYAVFRISIVDANDLVKWHLNLENLNQVFNMVFITCNCLNRGHKPLIRFKVSILMASILMIL